MYSIYACGVSICGMSVCKMFLLRDVCRKICAELPAAKSLVAGFHCAETFSAGSSSSVCQCRGCPYAGSLYAGFPCAR